MSIKNLLEIKNATLWRGSTRVFYNFSLDIKKNECVVIVNGFILEGDVLVHRSPCYRPTDV